MKKLYFLVILIMLFTGCVAYVENKENVSRIKSFGITDDEALDILDKAAAKAPEHKHEIRFFQGQ